MSLPARRAIEATTQASDPQSPVTKRLVVAPPGCAATTGDVALVVSVDELAFHDFELNENGESFDRLAILAESAATLLGPVRRTVFVATRAVARRRLDAFASSKANTWRIVQDAADARCALDGELSLLAELGRHSAVVLVSGSGACTGAVRALADRGIPTWILLPPRAEVAAALRCVSAALTAL